MDTNKLKQFVNDRITFLFDHWTMEDKRPYTFGGWREEVVNDIVQQIQQARDEEIIDGLEKEKNKFYVKEPEVLAYKKGLSKAISAIKSLSNKSGGSDD